MIGPFFNNNLVSGEVLNLNDSIRSNDIMISKEVAKLLKLDVSDDLIVYFIQEPSRVRKFNIRGIYNTAMVDFDKLYILGDIKHIQSLNSWQDTLIGGFEIAINDFKELDVITERVYEQIPYDLNAKSIKERVPQIFDWLDLQDVNARVVLILMLIVGVINMITALLILILERTHVIGILKAIGATNWSVRKIFLYSATNLIVKGLFLGNLLAFSFAFLQRHFSVISLDPETYYMHTIPISFNLSHILLLNCCTIVICYLILILPSVIITKITPIKAIRFE
jgi:lipoprotein-releasing system permease protein